jgi:hypothetical protein
MNQQNPKPAESELEIVSDPMNQIETLVTDCCVDLFSDYGVEITRVVDEPPPSNLAFCGVIGFTGPDMRGTLLLACSREPLVLAGDSAQFVRDWLAELANQLIGRVKNRLITLGTVIYYSTPIIVRGEHLAPLDNQPQSQLFRANGGIVSVWFDVDVRPDLVLASTPDASASALEGEALLF